MELNNINKSLSTHKKLVLNTFFSVLYQFIAVICGFILPRLILTFFGSETNGLLNSITQFLAVISFMELGVGAVIQSSLYKPMAHDDSEKVSSIVVAGDQFFRKIASILLVYSLILVFIFPKISSTDENWIYTASLVIAMSVSSFAQYYFGLMDSIILTTNQQGYIIYISQIFTIVGNTVASAVLINYGCSIQVVKIVSSLIFIIRPFFIRRYITKHYRINRKILVSGNPIKQKWDGLFQHISHIILENTDVIILTIFSTLKEVSIYSVYHLIIYGVKNVFISATHGLQSLLGEIWAREDKKRLVDFFSALDFGIHICVVFLFSCTNVLILPFITVYTNGINDAEYIQKVFAIIIVSANAFHCLRFPYHMLIKAAGEYKRTQRCFAISALVNLMVSIVGVITWGLIGVAIGTLIAMLFQTLWMAYFDSRYLIEWPIRNIVKQFSVDIIIALVIFIITKDISLGNISYISWIMMAMKVVVVSLIVCFVVSILFYKKQVLFALKLINKKRTK